VVAIVARNRCHWVPIILGPVTIPKRYRSHRISQAYGDTSSAEGDDRMMDRFRDDLARAIYISRSS
jgi:hypothetical protein